MASFYGWACERLYHELAWSYEAVAWGVSGGAWGAWRQCALRYVQGQRVLELGAGTGQLARFGARQGMEWVGLDLSPNMLASALHRNTSADMQPMIVRANAKSLPFGVDTFDSVVATFPAPFILSPETLQECVRVLDGPLARLVIVGLWVVPSWAEQILLPVLYGQPSEESLRLVAESIQTAGFATPHAHTVEVDGARVGVIVARPNVG